MSNLAKTAAAAKKEEERVGSPSPPPDPLLKALYKSERPSVDLLPGVGLSPIINGTWLSEDARVLLSGNWMVEPSAVAESEEPAEGAVMPPAFNPSAPEYNSLQKRLSKSAAMQKWNNLTIKLAIESAASREKGLEEREQQLKLQQVDIAKIMVQEAEILLGDLKASFLEDPLALLPWMQALFDLADAGLTTFDVSGAFWPYTQLRSLFSTNNTASYYEGAEKILGLFKRRYERERGKNKIQILTRLVPNIFHEGYNPAVVETLVDRMRINVYTSEAPEPLDLLQLIWWDLQAVDVLPTLKVLQQLTEDKIEPGVDGADDVLLEAKRVKGLALIDFPASALLAILQAGVPVVSVQLPHSLSERGHSKTLELAKEYGIKVVARDGLMGGLMSPKYIEAPCPDSMTTDADLESIPYAMDLINNYGGWERVQELLVTVAEVAAKHGVKMQTVALRWQIDQGTFPLVTTRWGTDSWRNYGHSTAGKNNKPGIDAALFQKASFLDASDAELLARLAPP